MSDARGIEPLHIGLLGACALVLIWSGTNPKDPLTWFLEVAPALLALIVMAATYRSFRLTDLLYCLIALHAVVLMVGGHYTYAEVPLGDWARDWLGQERNHYDRLGHVMQGFVPALVAREIFLRLGLLARPRWMFFLICCVALAISAFYEFIEWWVALLSEEAAESFLGTQGDNWDTQWDMFLALLGAMASQLLLARWHDRQLAALPRR
jgi:putative membrane protein